MRSLWRAALAVAVIAGALPACGGKEEPPEQTCEERARLVGRAFDEQGEARFPEFLVQTFSVFWNMEYDVDGVSIVEGFYPVSLLVPEDVTSIGVTLEVPSGNAILMEARADNQVLFALSPSMLPLTKANVVWLGIVSIVLPNNERTSVSGKCVDIWVAAADTDYDSPATMHVTSRRGEGASLNLNFVVDAALDVEDAALVAVAERAGDQLRGAFRVGEVTVERVAIGSTLAPTSSLADALGELPADDDGRLSVVLVDALLADEQDDQRVRAFVPGIPGTPFSGTEASYLRLSYGDHLSADGTLLLVDAMGDTLAHAVGKMFGLFHTTEARGMDVDPVDDTGRCLVRDYDLDRDGYVSPQECAAVDGANLMFWAWVPGVSLELTPMQLQVLQNHPLVLAEGETR